MRPPLTLHNGGPSGGRPSPSTAPAPPHGRVAAREEALLASPFPPLPCSQQNRLTRGAVGRERDREKGSPSRAQAFTFTIPWKPLMEGDCFSINSFRRLPLAPSRGGTQREGKGGKK